MRSKLLLSQIQRVPLNRLIFYPLRRLFRYDIGRGLASSTRKTGNLFASAKNLVLLVEDYYRGGMRTSRIRYICARDAKELQVVVKVLCTGSLVVWP